MAAELHSFEVSTSPGISIHDVTKQVRGIIDSAKIDSGIAVVSVAGSTASVSTMEFEPGLLKDIPRVLEKIAPPGFGWEHHKTWNDENGGSHILATLIGPSVSVPFEKKKLLLGTWQQIILLDFDRPARNRAVNVQVVG